MNDFADQFFIEEFAEIAQVGASSISVIFDYAHAQNDYGMTTVIGYQPILTCRTADVDRLSIKEDTQIVVRNTNYVVASVLDEGFGFSKIHLEKE